MAGLAVLVGLFLIAVALVVLATLARGSADAPARGHPDEPHDDERGEDGE